jgi:hypothetical protein
MKTENKYPAGYTKVDNRLNAQHRFFRGNGYALAIFWDLVMRRAHEPTTKKLRKNNKREVPVIRDQTLTSVRTLMKIHGFTKHHCEHALPYLVEKGMIAVQNCADMKGFSRNDGQVITVLKGFEMPSSDTSSDEINSSSSKTKANGVTKEDVDRVAQAMADSAVVPSELDTPEVREAWGDFIVHRKQLDPKSRGMTERASKIILNKLLDAKVMPDEAVRTFNAAIESGWKGVFPKERTIKAVKRTGKSSYTPAGPELLVANDMMEVA